MAGHNKWSKVKHIKARVDAIKGRVFSKCAHEIALAARAGGGDPVANARLRTAIDNAKAVSMPKDNIDRAIKKGTGELGGEMIQEISYEGYGPAGIAFIIEMATDNLNRVAADIRLIFSKNGGSVATPGSVSYQFDRKGEIRINAADLSRLTKSWRPPSRPVRTTCKRCRRAPRPHRRQRARHRRQHPPRQRPDAGFGKTRFHSPNPVSAIYMPASPQARMTFSTITPTP